MGQYVCTCLEDGAEGPDPDAKLGALKIGMKFSRSIYLGLSSQELHMRLSDDTSAVSWRVLTSGEDFGEIDLTTVKTLRSKGADGIEYVTFENKVVFEVKAIDTASRDQWIVSLNELLAFWAENKEKKPTSGLSAKGTSNKAEYFKNKEMEIKQREKDAEEKKKKYSSGGMKYTALAMVARGDGS